MKAIWRKEIMLFFSSATGFLSIAIFLIASGLVLFLFPETSILDYGYATLDPFFDFAPYLFLFLIPAITMRSWAEEKSTQTIELLGTKPISLSYIIIGKYISTITIILLALLPTITYVFILSKLADPIGNIDKGGIIGSYIGLSLLAFCFAAIGMLASSISRNQVTSFVLALFLCFTMYYAFTSISQIPWLIGKGDYFIQQIGIESHYAALSNGVLTMVDIIYFISVIVLFLWASFVYLTLKTT